MVISECYHFQRRETDSSAVLHPRCKEFLVRLKESLSGNMRMLVEMC